MQKPCNSERSFAAPRTFADEYVEYWAGVYLANPQIAQRGALFETFLLAPAEILAAVARPVIAVTRDGLLVRQLRVRQRADLEAALQELAEKALRALAAESHCANGVWCEKLRHHAWSARRPAFRKPMEIEL